MGLDVKELAVIEMSHCKQQGGKKKQNVFAAPVARGDLAVAAGPPAAQSLFPAALAPLLTRPEQVTPCEPQIWGSVRVGDSRARLLCLRCRALLPPSILPTRSDPYLWKPHFQTPFQPLVWHPNTIPERRVQLRGRDRTHAA